MDAVFDPGLWKVWGPLGLYALVMTYFVWKLYRDGQDDRKSFEAQLTKERETCEKERKDRAEELRQFEERYVMKAETWMTKYEEFSKVATQVVDAAMRRYRRDSGGHSNERSPEG